ncbi:MAG: DUF3943 domain-containing protein [Candidatus Rokuibacteriota bacterium]|nr:MAG: DUF3943 domain-containing protein [Candidatus Rokubacteria bacterium]
MLRRALAAGALTLALVTPAAAAEERARPTRILDWDTGEGRSYWIPAVEVAGFVFALNQFDRHVFDKETYDTDGHTFWKNLRTAPIYDKDPFSVNQIGHPYQGSIYYGFARSAGLEYWESSLYTVGGSFLWETYGETTKPSINDHVASGIGGTFVGEAAFRMASLLLEGGGERPGFWRELGAALISPSTGFNRLAFGERFAPVFPSRDPEVFIRLRIGATLTAHVDNPGLSESVKRQEGSVDYSITYGLPGKPGYRYSRPFDYFHFEFTGVPNSSTVGNALENVSIRGLLAGTRYEWGDAYRGLWGLFGGYDYLSPQVFRVATTNAGLGTVFQWWLSPTVALQTTAIGGVGFGAAGTVADQAESDYHYGVIPQTLLGLRLIFGERAMLEASGRQYYVIGTGSGPESSTSDFGAETIVRGNVGFTVRLFGPHALGIQYLVSDREARIPNHRDRHQLVETVSISYNFLGHSRFGATEWRPAMTGGR